MKSWYRALAAVALAAIVWTGLGAPPALAAGADKVWINNYMLDSSVQYWKNGGTAGTASDFNAAFDPVTSTLTLDAAILTALYAAPSGDGALVYADGDLTVILKNDSSLTYHGTSLYDIRGIWTTGTLTLSGTGTVDIDLQNNASGSGYAVGIVSGYDLNVQGGDYDLQIDATDNATGISAARDTAISGGQISIHTTGRDGRGIDGGGNVDISGGWISTAGTHTNVSIGLYGDEIFLRGGDGLFQAGGAFIACGLMFQNDTLHVSGGSFVFSGGSYAMNFTGTAPPAYDLRGVDTFVSDDAAGLGRWQWTSKADGELAASATPSPFRYVQFSERRAQSAASAAAPQTGDGASPWVWAGLALCAAICAARMAIAVRKRFA